MRPWRSLLFVPAGATGRWEKAHTRGADAIIIDLEDSIREDAKPAARAQAGNAVRTLSSNGVTVTARVNNDPLHLESDLQAVVCRELTALVMPKVESHDDLEKLSDMLDRLEKARRLEPGTLKVIAVIESPRALERIRAIADGPRLIGLSLGSEDFALSLGRPPTPMSLRLAAQTVAYAAAARGIMGIGMASGISDYSDLNAFETEAMQSYAMGLTGAMCIHPNQVAVLNRCFGPSAEEIAQAREVLAAWTAQTDGVASLNGRMIDQPVVERARRLLSSAGLA